MLFAGVCLLALFSLSPPAQAQQKTELASAQARTAQYVFVIDDSGSMSRTVRGIDAADPDRLAVFAARSTLSMLDDSDEATVVRLNGPLDGDASAPIEPLSDNRSRLDEMLALDGPVARYAGERTPCKSALDALKKSLNEAYRRDVAQVVMFLTDGECTGDKPTVDAFLKGLDSADDELFKFYLLRFEGRKYTAALEELANQTGGQAIEASANDPSAILEPFASALSASQGYESYLLSPQNHRLAAHKGARRVRLLAVAPDKGNDLDFSIDPARKGEQPKLIGAAKKGVHQFEDGRRYRYAAVDYRPGTVPVNVGVKGAGGDWKVVAVPEYRLFVEVDVLGGRCDDADKKVRYAEVGSSVCAEVRMVNEDGEVVTSDVAGRGTEAFVRYTSADADEPRELPASRDGDKARFLIERANLEEGDHIFRPTVRLSVPGRDGATVDVKGGAHTLQVSSMTVSAKPGELDLGTLVPGDEKFEDISVDGNFPAAKARLVVQNRDNVPECVQFALSGEQEGEAQKITAGQTYTVGVDVEPYCGAASFKRDIATALRVEFDPSGQMMSVPTLVIPVRFSLVSDISVPDALRADITAGDSEQLELVLSGNFKRDARFKLLVPPADERADWPSDAGDLDIEFLDDELDAIHGEDGELARTQEVTFRAGDGAEAIALRAQSDACCSDGTYRTELALVPLSGTKEPIRVPVEIDVEKASAWSCWGPTILWALLALLVLLLALFLYNLWQNTNLLSKKKLINQIVVLEWGPTGRPTEAPNSPQQVESFVDKGMSFGDRFKAWLAANPLKIGLPNDYRYDETVRVVLDVDQPRRSSLNVLDKPGHHDGLLKNPRVDGLVYASATKQFYGVPDLDGYIGSLHKQNHMSLPSGELEIADLMGTELVLDDTDRDPGTPAGYKFRY